MNLELESSIAIISIVISATLAIVALLQNASAVRKSNRIAMSTKLVEASKLLSDELTASCRSYQLYITEMKEAEARPDSDVKKKKVNNLRELIHHSERRQKELDDHLKEIQELFKKLDSVDTGILDSAISRSYGNQKLAASSLELAKELKQRNDRA